MKTHLIHGFNVTDGGRGTISRLKKFFELPIVHDIGWIGLVSLRCRNKAIVRRMIPFISSKDVLVAHSNGALITYELIEAGAKPKAIILFNAALRRDARWPDDLLVLNFHSSKDWVVQLARVWSRLTSLGGLTPHGWGSAGKYGFTSNQSNVTNVDMAEDINGHAIKSHSAVFKRKHVDYWGRIAGDWGKFV